MNCVICKKKIKNKTLYNNFDFKFLKKNIFLNIKIFLCNYCNLGFVKKKILDLDLKNFYKFEYSSSDGTHFLSGIPNFFYKFSNYFNVRAYSQIKLIKEYIDFSNKSILEIGPSYPDFYLTLKKFFFNFYYDCCEDDEKVKKKFKNLNVNFTNIDILKKYKLINIENMI